jgi:hypothetical protein
MAPLTLFLALLLGLSAGHKLVARDSLAPVAARLVGVATPLGPVLLFAAAGIEALSALALLAAPMPIGGTMAALLWSAYALALWRRRARRFDCGCDFVRRERRVGTTAIARPVLLAGLALVQLAVPFTWTPDAPFAALALLALWFAAAELSALPQAVRKMP